MVSLSASIVLIFYIHTTHVYRTEYLLLQKLPLKSSSCNFMSLLPLSVSSSSLLQTSSFSTDYPTYIPTGICDKVLVYMFVKDNTFVKVPYEFTKNRPRSQHS